MTVDGVQVQQVAGHLQPPQVRLQSSIRVKQMGGHSVEPDSKRAPGFQLIRAPVHGQRRVETIGDQLGISGALSFAQRLLREGQPARLLPRVHPAPRQSSRQPGVENLVGCPLQHFEQQRRESAGLGAEHVHRSRAQQGARPPLEVTGRATLGSRFRIEAGSSPQLTRSASGVRGTEEVRDLSPHHRPMLGARSSARPCPQLRSSRMACACSACLRSSQSPVQYTDISVI